MADIEFTYLKLSLKNLEEQFANYKTMDDNLPNLMREAVAESTIKRFEIHFDCLKKVLQKYARDRGATTAETEYAKDIFRAADRVDLLDSQADKWIAYTDMRNDTTHEYDGEMVEKILGTMDRFIDDAIGLYQTLSGESWE